MCLEVLHRILDHWYINSRRQVAHVTKFCSVEHKIFSIITAVVGLFLKKSVCHFTHTNQKASDKIDARRSYRNCGFSVCNWLRVTLRASQI
jgi:hypothetical protein